MGTLSPLLTVTMYVPPQLENKTVGIVPRIRLGSDEVVRYLVIQCEGDKLKPWALKKITPRPITRT